MWEWAEYEAQEADVNLLIVSTRLKIAQMRQMLHSPKSKFTEAQRAEIQGVIDQLEAQMDILANRHDTEDPNDLDPTTVAGVGSILIAGILAVFAVLAFIFS